MIIRIVHHWCKPDSIEAGRAQIERTGRELAAAQGFVYRYRVESEARPDVLTTITAWHSQEALSRFQAGRPAHDTSDPAYPFARIEHEAFAVKSAIGDARATIG